MSEHENSIQRTRKRFGGPRPPDSTPARPERASCENGHHAFPVGVPICWCGECDTRNDPPRVTCPTCHGEGEIEGSAIVTPERELHELVSDAFSEGFDAGQRPRGWLEASHWNASEARRRLALFAKGPQAHDEEDAHRPRTSDSTSAGERTTAASESRGVAGDQRPMGGSATRSGERGTPEGSEEIVPPDAARLQQTELERLFEHLSDASLWCFYSYDAPVRGKQIKELVNAQAVTLRRVQQESNELACQVRELTARLGVQRTERDALLARERHG